MVDWTKARIDAVYELRQDGLTADEIGAVFGCSGDCVRTIARKKGFPFNRAGSDIGKQAPQYACMRCKTNRVDGRWQRCVKCRETVAEIQGGMSEHSLHAL